jgi:coenzyme F420-0:L-glutamate ligase/coenzyme F420-1:gamma-L-glutamate ligase
VGQVDFALGAHGVHVADDLRGAFDADGKPLEVTTRALADEIASAADLAKGKVTAVPAAIVRGLGDLVPEAAGRGEPRGRDLVRTGPNDWFGYGRVEAVRAALGVEPGSATAAQVGIAPVSSSTRVEAVARAVRTAMHTVEGATADIGAQSVTLDADSPFDLGRLVARLESALWCEWLTATLRGTSADGLSAVIDIEGIHSRPHP